MKIHYSRHETNVVILFASLLRHISEWNGFSNKNIAWCFSKLHHNDLDKIESMQVRDCFGIY